MLSYSHGTCISKALLESVCTCQTAQDKSMECICSKVWQCRHAEEEQQHIPPVELHQGQGSWPMPSQ